MTWWPSALYDVAAMSSALAALSAEPTSEAPSVAAARIPACTTSCTPSSRMRSLRRRDGALLLYRERGRSSNPSEHGARLIVSAWPAICLLCPFPPALTKALRTPSLQGRDLVGNLRTRILANIDHRAARPWFGELALW